MTNHLDQIDWIDYGTPWALCNTKSHLWLYGSSSSSSREEPHDSMRCQCGLKTWGEWKREIEQLERQKWERFTRELGPTLHPRIAWLLLTVLLVALVLAGGAPW